MIVLDIVLAALAMAMAVPVLILAVEVLAACLPARAASAGADTMARPRIAVLVPAHDEEAGIEATIRSLLPELADGDRLLVVADNCTDATAAVARAAGAEVIERQDPLRRGKGYALDFGVRHLESQPPDVVLVIDADCRVSPGMPAVLAATAVKEGRPVQAFNQVNSSPDPSPRDRIAAFAWTVKTHVRPMGLRALGLPCQLMGTGMAFPWPVIRDAELATGHLVEDLKLGLDLAAAGAAPLYCPGVRVISDAPSAEGAVTTQRQRWETGSLQILLGTAPRMILRALRSGRFNLLAMALDLLVPPLMLLVMVLGGLLAVTAVSWLVGGSSLTLIVAAVAFTALVLTLILAWLRHARHTVSIADLAQLPAILVRKLSFYAQSWRNRNRGWIRTDRQ